MITFNPELVIVPPPHSDQSGAVIQPPNIVIGQAKITYIDTPHLKTLAVRLESVPAMVTLYKDAAYDEAGNWTEEQAEARLLEILGSEPAVYLRKLFPVTMEENPNGPGTILSKMIKTLGIVMSDSCSCRRHAIEMNTKGNDWCEKNIDTVVGWLREEADKRGLPFVDIIGRLMVNRAVKKSRKLLANEPVPENDEDLDQE
jgi:hypothetical protein